MHSIDTKLIERGLKVAGSKIFQEDKIWSKYSSDKVEIGETLAKVLRTLYKALPLATPIRALSIGSSNEPQFRILETASQGGLYLLDIEKEALQIVKERIHRQHTRHVKTIRGDYNKIFLNLKNTRSFFQAKLDGKRMNLVTLHHSLYYCDEKSWQSFLNHLFACLLAPTGVIHAVLMAAKSHLSYTTSWIYDHFVGKFFGQHNTQDLQKCSRELRKDRLYKGEQILSKESQVYFWVDDFEKLMAVVWMILLYPNVHPYSRKQREEIVEFIYKKFWIPKRPLVQIQDHLVIYRGVGFKGLI